jgi:hypothetical protein
MSKARSRVVGWLSFSFVFYEKNINAPTFMPPSVLLSLKTRAPAILILEGPMFIESGGNVVAVLGLGTVSVSFTFFFSLRKQSMGIGYEWNRIFNLQF